VVRPFGEERRFGGVVLQVGLLLADLGGVQRWLGDVHVAGFHQRLHLPEEEQKTIRRGIKNGNMIFKKGKSDALTFKNNEESHGVFVADESKKAILKESKVKKIYIGKGIHFYPKANIGQFLIEENDLAIGDKILIKGSTTGEQEMTISEMFVNEIAAKSAVSGDSCTFKLPFRIRLSDKLYKIIS